MSFKKNPTVEELQREVELLRNYVIVLKAKNNVLIEDSDNHPAMAELEALRSKWYVRLFGRGR